MTVATVALPINLPLEMLKLLQTIATWHGFIAFAAVLAIASLVIHLIYRAKNKRLDKKFEEIKEQRSRYQEID